FHQRLKALVAEVRKRVIPVAALAKQGMRSSLHGVDLQVLIQTGGFAGGSEQREQALCEGSEHQQPIAARRVLDVSAGQTEPEAQVFLVSECLFDREAFAVEFNDLVR